MFVVIVVTTAAEHERYCIQFMQELLSLSCKYEAD